MVGKSVNSTWLLVFQVNMADQHWDLWRIHGHRGFTTNKNRHNQPSVMLTTNINQPSSIKTSNPHYIKHPHNINIYCTKHHEPSLTNNNHQLESATLVFRCCLRQKLRQVATLLGSGLASHSSALPRRATVEQDSHNSGVFSCQFMVDG